MDLKRIMVATMGVALSVCAANAQSWKSNSYGLYSYPLTGNTSNVAIGITPTSSTASYKLYVKGATYVNGASTVTGALKTNSSLTAAGSLTVSGKSFLSAVTASGDIYGKSKLTVDGYTYLNGASTLVGKATLAGGFSATSPCTISSSLTTSSLTVSGNTTMNGNLICKGTDNRFNKWLRVYATDEAGKVNLLISKDNRVTEGMNITSSGKNNVADLSISAMNFSFITDGNAKIMTMKKNNVNMLANLDVTGKITCHNEIEVAEVLKANQIKAQDINVELNNAADYVFEENYNLRPLSEVESYVKENKHLPGVPSAAEISENGMSVSQMSNLLLEKVEELTLHMIELEKENKALKAEMEMLKK